MPFSFLRSELSQLQAYTTHADTEHLPPAQLDILDTNEFPADLPPDLKQKFVDFLWKAIPANRYPDGSHLQVKAAIINYVNSQLSPSEQPLTPEQVSLGCGSDELIRSILLACCGPGQGSILIAEPTFSMYGILAQGLGIKVTKIGRHPDTFEMDLEAAEEVLKQQAIQVIFVVHPNSPTGNALTPTEQAWLRTIPDSVLVVIDEAYFEFSGQTLAGELAAHPNWLILRTFSKAWRLAAFRVGYGLGHPEVILALEKLRLPYNLTAPSLAAAELVLSEQKSLLGEVPGLLEQREQMFQALQAIPQLRVWPSAGNFIYVQAKDSATTQHLAQRLRQAGSLVRFTCGGIRLTIGTTAENQRVLNRIQAWAKTA